MLSCLTDVLPQHRSCATDALNRVPPVEDVTPKSVSDTNCYDTADVHGLDFPSDPQETPLGKAGRIFRRSPSRHVDEFNRTVLDDDDGQDIQHVHQIQQDFANWCFQHGNYQDDNYAELANRHSKVAAAKAATKSATNVGQSKKSQQDDIGHVVRNSHISQAVQGIQHVEDTQIVHDDQYARQGNHQHDRYSENADHYSKMSTLKAVAQSAVGLGQSGRSPIDEEGSDGPQLQQRSPRSIPTDPKKRLPKSNDKHIVPSGEMKESSLHSSARKRIRFSNENHNMEIDQLDWESLLCEHNMNHESKAKGNETHTQQAIESKKSKEPPQKSEAGDQSFMSTPNEIRRKYTTSSGPVMGTFKTPWQMSHDAVAKKQAKASKPMGVNAEAPAIDISTRAAHIPVRNRETHRPSVRSSTYVFQSADLGVGMPNKRKLAAEKHGLRKRAAPVNSNEVLEGSKYLPAFPPDTYIFQLVLSQNDEPKDSLSRTQKAPKKSIPKSSKSTLTTPAVVRLDSKKYPQPVFDIIPRPARLGPAADFTPMRPRLWPTIRIRILILMKMRRRMMRRCVAQDRWATPVRG